MRKAQVGTSRPTPVRMWLLCGFAFLAAAQSAVGDFGASVYVALAAFVSAVLAELFVTHRVHGFRKIMDGSAAASALVLALLLPNYIHPMHAALGAFFAIAVVKHSFGGLGSNWMNPALGGWLFVRFSWPESFSMALEFDGQYGYVQGVGSLADLAIRDFLNRTVFPLLGAELPAGYIDVFWLQAPGIIADRAVLALLVLVAAMFAFRSSRWWVSVAYLAVFALLARMAGDIPFGGYWWEGDILMALLSGGTLVTAFVLLAEPSSGAKSMPGALVMAVFAAALSFAFRYFGGEAYGGFFAVALVNALAPLLRGLERRLFYAQPSEARLLLEARFLLEAPAWEAGDAETLSRGGPV